MSENLEQQVTRGLGNQPQQPIQQTPQVETKQEADLADIEKMVVSDSYDNYLQLASETKERLSWHG